MTSKPTATYRIRRASRADLDALLALENASFTSDLLTRRRMRHWISAPHGILVVAEAIDASAPAGDSETRQQHEPLAGYCLAMVRRNSVMARAYSLAIAASARGQGLGAQLLQQAEAESRLMGCASIQLEVATGNVAAIALYEKLRYERVALIPGFYEDGQDALRMRKHFG